MKKQEGSLKESYILTKENILPKLKETSCKSLWGKDIVQVQTIDLQLWPWPWVGMVES